ncbi:hypothetical protein VNO78_14714 [Psophocarpus tetragonolobus]|uniref:Uncharacterized protein n=1 Tax=Psophocarpus tetragonolobus TaxID=3891 RepID=A0AAN9SH79_PSOTE
MYASVCGSKVFWLLMIMFYVSIKRVLMMQCSYIVSDVFSIPHLVLVDYCYHLIGFPFSITLKWDGWLTN